MKSLKVFDIRMASGRIFGQQTPKDWNKSCHAREHHVKSAQEQVVRNNPFLCRSLTI